MQRSRIEQLLAYSFSDISLLETALTHRSHSTPHNERLEFIGDGILNSVIAVLLYQRFPELAEGDLSRLRASLVRQNTLHMLAIQLDLGLHLRLGEGELKSGGQSRPSILADAFEAIIGAIYLDGGYPAIHDWLAQIYKDKLSALTPGQTMKDAKSRLQEYLQARRFSPPRYTLLGPHREGFEVLCEIPELNLKTQGIGQNRRIAEQVAAETALQHCPES